MLVLLVLMLVLLVLLVVGPMVMPAVPLVEATLLLVRLLGLVLPLARPPMVLRSPRKAKPSLAWQLGTAKVPASTPCSRFGSDSSPEGPTPT